MTVINPKHLLSPVFLIANSNLLLRGSCSLDCQVLSGRAISYLVLNLQTHQYSVYYIWMIYRALTPNEDSGVLEIEGTIVLSLTLYQVGTAA